MPNEKSIGYLIFKDKAFKGLTFLLALLGALPLFLILFYVLKLGIPALNWRFLSELPKAPGETGGGISNAITGTLQLILYASLFSIPPGVLAGIFLSEEKEGRLAYWARLAIDVLQGIPSVVIGIVVYAWVVVKMGGFSMISGACALALIMLPMIVKSTEETLKLIPHALKEASLALGASYSKTLFKVIVPSGLSGILTGILLGIARIAGETAPLLFTAFGNPFSDFNPLKPVNALPLLIFNYAESPYPDWHTLAWGTSAVLIIMVLTLNLLSRAATKKWKIQF